MSSATSVCLACGFAERVERFPRLSAVVNYYLCKRCGHIWAIRKNDPKMVDHFRPLPKTSR